MRSHNKLLAALVGAVLAIALVAAPAPARAAEEMKVGFMLDFTPGVAIPIGDSTYKHYFDASFQLGFRIGAVLYISRHFGIAPEGEFDFMPLTADSSQFPDYTHPSIFRERGLFGARFIIPFGIGSFYARFAMGVDHIGGNYTVNVGPFGASASVSSTAFAIQPGLGLQFNVIRHLVVGFATDFPIAWHNFTSSDNNKFTAVDVDFLAVIGLRI
jgi:hypothetical protein